MLASIKFTTGDRAHTIHVYKNKNLFTLSYVGADGEPLYLTDFESIEIIDRPSLGQSTIKCTLTNGKQYLAQVSPFMLDVLERYIFEKSQTDETPPVPKIDYDSFWIRFAIVLFAMSIFFKSIGRLLN